MNKRIKGFTLVELLAVIVILSLLLLVTVTTVSSQFKNSKDDLYDTQLNNIKLAAEMWGSDNKTKLNSISDCVSLTLGYLKEEGYVREILSKVQNMRKDSGFEVMDNINLYVSGNEMLENVVKKFEDTIKHDTLAKNVFYNEPNKEYQDVSINGENLKLFVEVV